MSAFWIRRVDGTVNERNGERGEENFEKAKQISYSNNLVPPSRKRHHSSSRFKIDVN